MRKQQQKQIFELLATIGKAQSAGLYADAQEGALAISEFIKKVDGENTPTVTLLEEYCKLLFEANHMELALRNQLSKVEDSICGDLKPNKIEIVFLSYNASMSDSIFTIYQAAKADPDCDAVWLPIPYFELNSNGSIGSLRFDGAECYDDRVECSDWRKYDIKTCHPDIIVTYAPYDDGNFITRVHPDFFCRRLRELTDLLVYIPYFISSEFLEKDFCVVPGCVFAHKVMVQSEKIRSVYIREFRKAYGDQFGRPEDKFIVMGSPKFDAVLNTRRENLQLPDTWERLIGNAGQDRKKVVLYNTSVTAILNGNELYLKKLRQVLNTFHERDDVVLLWRPHPLSKSTFAAMRPKLMDEYEQIVEDYKREGWGIYDDSPDIHRAIAVSDAYYGDGSSVVPMYGITGKPILLQQTSLNITDIHDYAIILESLYDDKGYLWFAAVDFNALFRMDKHTWIPEYMGSFPNADISTTRISSGLVCHNSKLYFAPFNGSKFYIYNLVNQTFETIHVPERLSVAIKSSEFISVTAYKQYIFYIGYTFKGIVRYDSESGNIQCYNNWVKRLDHLTGRCDHLYFVYVHAVNNKLYCPCIFAKAILIFNMDTCEYEIIELNSKAEGFRSIAFDGRSFWLASETDSKYLVEWDGVSKNVIEHDNPQSTNTGLWDVTTVGKHIWFLPTTSNTSFRINCNAIEAVNELSNLHSNSNGLEWIRYAVVDQLIYLSKKGILENSLISFNTATNELRTKQLRLDEKQYEKITPLLKRVFRDRANQCQTWKDCLINESVLFNLNSYLDFVTYDYITPEARILYDKQTELFKQMTVNSDGTAGKAIYNYTKEFILEQENC